MRNAAAGILVAGFVLAFATGEAAADQTTQQFTSACAQAAPPAGKSLSYGDSWPGSSVWSDCILAAVTVTHSGFRASYVPTTPQTICPPAAADVSVEAQMETVLAWLKQHPGVQGQASFDGLETAYTAVYPCR